MADKATLVDKVQDLFGKRIPIEALDTPLGWTIYIPERGVNDKTVLVNSEEGIINLHDRLKAKLTSYLTAHLDLLARNAIWRGEYGKITPELLERDGINLVQTLADNSYFAAALDSLHQKIQAGERLIDEIAVLLLEKTKGSITLENETYVVTYKTEGIEIRGEMTVNGAHPTRIVSDSNKLIRDMNYKSLENLKNTLAALPDTQVGLTVGWSAFWKQVERRTRQFIAKREEELVERLEKIQAIGLNVYSGTGPTSSEAVVRRIMSKIATINKEKLPELEVSTSFDWGHGRDLAFSVKIDPSKLQLGNASLLYATNGNFTVLGIALGSDEFFLVPANSALYGQGLSGLLKLGYVATSSTELTKKAVGLVLDRIVTKGTAIGFQVFNEHQIDLRDILTKLSNIEMRDQDTYSGTISGLVDNLYARLENLEGESGRLCSQEVQIYDETLKQPSFLEALRGFSASLKILKTERKIGSFLDKAIATYVLQTNGKNVTAYLMLAKTDIGIRLDYKE